MATEKYPQRNVNYPFPKHAVEAMRAKLAPKHSPSVPVPARAGEKGSRREVRPGEWIDDRVIVIDGPASPSGDNGRPEPRRESKALPSFDSGHVYGVQLSKPVQQDGQWLSPAISYQMIGDVCTELSGSILTADDLGEIPAENYPDPQARK